MTTTQETPENNNGPPGLFEKFEKEAVVLCKDEAFKKVFKRLSETGDRRRMIETMMKFDKIRNFPVGEHFSGKDDKQSNSLLESFLEIHKTKKSADNISILNEALSKAPFCSELFFKILLQRISTWLELGEIARCIKDCGNLRQLATSIDDVEESPLVGYIIDSLLIQSECLKLVQASNESKNLLHEAMRKINEIASKTNLENGDDLKTLKMALLQKYLQKAKAFSASLSENNLKCHYFQEKTQEIPKVFGKPNKLLTCCSDAVDLSIDSIKGRSLRALKNIKPDTVLIVDEPFAFTTDIDGLLTNCLNCHVSLRLKHITTIPCHQCSRVQFCSDKCRLDACDKFHKFECKIFDYFYEQRYHCLSSQMLLAYRTTVIGEFGSVCDQVAIDEDFMKFHEDTKSIPGTETLEKYEPHDYRTVANLTSHCVDSAPNENFYSGIYSIFLAKCLLSALKDIIPNLKIEQNLEILAAANFHHLHITNCNAYEIVENIRNEDTKVYEPRNFGGAIYTTVSLTNHSCYPNVVRHTFPCGTVVVKSVRFIPKGTEIVDCYGQHFLENKRDSRRRLLEQKYYFDCQCEACDADWSSFLPNDAFNFKCAKCSKQFSKNARTLECTNCGYKVEIKKMYILLQNSIKNRLNALSKMYEGKYDQALPLLLEHANCIEKILVQPNLETMKTQQSIIQCFNATSSTSS